jgi:hypothetical protein
LTTCLAFLTNMELVYLAAPYTHSDKFVVEGRMRNLCIVDAALMKRGVMTASPLMKHFLLEHADLPGDWDYWKDYAEVLLSKCDKMIVVMMHGWEESVGVQAEIRLCGKFGIPVEYIDPFTLEGWRKDENTTRTV